MHGSPAPNALLKIHSATIKLLKYFKIIRFHEDNFLSLSNFYLCIHILAGAFV